MPSRIKAGVLISGCVALLLLFLAYRHFGKAHKGSARPSTLIPSPVAEKSGGARTSAQSVNAMAAAYDTGLLPDPLPPPSKDVDQAAVELARQVLVRNETSTRALMTALQMSGFSVRGQDGNILLTSVAQGQGIYFEAEQVAAMAKEFGAGLHAKLADLGDAFQSGLPKLKNAPVTEALLEGIRTATKSDQAGRHFWGQFIVELGRHSDQSYDLLSPGVDISKVELDAVQLSLVLQRLAADLVILKHRIQKTEGRRENPQPGLTDAVWDETDRPRLIRVDEASTGNQVCHLAEIAVQILDSSAYSMTFGYDRLLAWLTEHGNMPGAEDYNKVNDLLNSVLAVLKLMAFYAALDTDITMDGAPALVRTKSSTQPGEKRSLTGTVKLDYGKWKAAEIINCMRIIMNAAGLDLSVPVSGPLAGTRLDWVLVDGGLEIDHSTGEITWPIVEFVGPEGSPTIQGPGTYAGPAGLGGVAAQDITATTTDEQGHATIRLEGTPQKHPSLDGYKLIPKMKRAEVRFAVAPKPIGLSQDAIDSLGAGVPAVFSGGVAAPIVFAVEVLLRSRIHFSKPLVVPVKDWQPCEGGWGGTIHYSWTIATGGNTSSGSITRTEKSELTETGEFQLQGDRSTAGWGGRSQGTFSSTYNTKRDAQWSDAGCWDFAKGGSTSSGSGNAECQISPQQDSKYQIGCRGEGDLEGQYSTHFSKGGTCPPGTVRPDEAGPVKGPASFFPPVTTGADPDQPDVLHGSASSSIGPKSIQVTWNLALCK